jgi:hypothetical protein
MLRTPMVQRRTIGGLRESGSAMRIIIAMESKRAIIISREMIRVAPLKVVTDVVVTLILQRSVQLLSIWCRCINNQSRAKRHWVGVKNIFRYLQGTKDLGLFY